MTVLSFAVESVEAGSVWPLYIESLCSLLSVSDCVQEDLGFLFVCMLLSFLARSGSPHFHAPAPSYPSSHYSRP